MIQYESRKEIPQQWTWDLSKLYEGDEAFLSEYTELESSLQSLRDFKGRLLESSETLLAFIQISEALERRLEKLYMYAHLQHDLDTREGKYQDYFSRMQSLFARFGEAVSFFTPEILSQAERVEELLTGELALYKKFFERILRKKEHVLSDAEEALLAGMSEISATAGNVFGLLNNADFVFPTIKDEKGEDLQLTHGNFIRTLQSPDRRVREEAFRAYYSVFQEHRNTLAGLLQAEVKSHVLHARVRHYDSARQAALDNNLIPESVYDNLIDAVHEALPAMYRYLDIRKQVLGLEEMHMYDVHVPLLSEIDMEIPYEKGQTMVKEALAPLGEEYSNVLQQAFQERWVDVYETPGKRSGAYSSGGYDTIPYILMNYQNNMDNVFTLAHEFGHSMHSWMTHQKQPFVYGNYGIFLAEIASTFNEAMLNQYLLDTLPEKEQKLYVLNHYLDAFKSTLFRQTMFAEFERDIHRYVEEGGTLTSPWLNEHYLELNKKYFGEDVVSDEEIAFEWSRIPHFYYNFYVYQYATGMSAATALAKKVMDQEEGALERYLGFLQAGSSEDPMDVLRSAGVDLTGPEAVREALKVFAQKVEEFESLIL